MPCSTNITALGFEDDYAVKIMMGCNVSGVLRSATCAEIRDGGCCVPNMD